MPLPISPKLFKEPPLLQTKNPCPPPCQVPPIPLFTVIHHSISCHVREALSDLHIPSCRIQEAPCHLHIPSYRIQEVLCHLHIPSCGIQDALCHLHIRLIGEPGGFLKVGSLSTRHTNPSSRSPVRLMRSWSKHVHLADVCAAWGKRVHLGGSVCV